MGKPPGIGNVRGMSLVTAVILMKETKEGRKEMWENLTSSWSQKAIYLLRDDSPKEQLKKKVMCLMQKWGINC